MILSVVLVAAAPVAAATTVTPVLKLELAAEAGSVTVLYRGQRLAVYQFKPSTNQPCLAELYSLAGTGVLESAPVDDPPLHGMMLGWRINGIDYGDHGAAAGVQQTGGRISRHVFRDPTGQPVAEIAHQVFWARARPAIARPNEAWLIEDRALRFRVDETRREVAVEWRSDFEVSRAAEVVGLTGADTRGLGVRLARAFDLTARRMNSVDLSFSTIATSEFTEAGWLAMNQEVEGRNLTVALLADPANPGRGRFFSKLDLFAFVASAPDWAETPLTYFAGDRFGFGWMLLVNEREVSGEDLAARHEEWVNARNPRR